MDVVWPVLVGVKDVALAFARVLDKDATDCAKPLVRRGIVEAPDCPFPSQSHLLQGTLWGMNVVGLSHSDIQGCLQPDVDDAVVVVDQSEKHVDNVMNRWRVKRVSLATIDP